MLRKLIANVLRTSRRRNGSGTSSQTGYATGQDAATGGAEESTAEPDPLDQAQGLAKGGQLAAALEFYQGWVHAHPADIRAHIEMGNVLADLWSIEEAVAAYSRAVELAPTSSPIYSGLLFLTHYLACVDPERMFRLHQGFGETLRTAVAPNSGYPGCVWDPDRRLRVGYVSPNFSRHSVGYFAEPVIRCHDRSRNEIYCYYNHPWSDDTTQRFRGLADTWRPIADMPDDAVDRLIRDDRIDILVDLAGHTRFNRLELLARKPAPVQMTWLGYPDTTGLEAMDYLITDAVTGPYGDADRWYTERLLRMDNAFLCYHPPDDAPSVGWPSAEHIVFASCNNLAKVNEPMIRIWAQILRQVPESRMILKAARLDCADTVARVRDCFRRNHVELERVEFKAWIATRSHHLDFYRSVDIALDTFPYNGTTTTCEALWMGVPVVSLAGTVHMSRVGASILRCVGLEGLAATSAEGYIATAVALARDENWRQELRTGMRSRVTASPLLDHEGFTRNLERHYRQCWIDRCKREMTAPQ